MGVRGATQYGVSATQRQEAERRGARLPSRPPGSQIMDFPCVPAQFEATEVILKGSYQRQTGKTLARPAPISPFPPVLNDKDFLPVSLNHLTSVYWVTTAHVNFSRAGFPSILTMS